MLDTLRERIAQKVRGYVEHAGNEDSIAGAILPLVEQAIQQEREKWMAIVREVQDECDAILNEQPDVKSERLVAAAEGVRAILPLMAQAEKRAEAAESALAGARTEIARLKDLWSQASSSARLKWPTRDAVPEVQCPSHGLMPSTNGVCPVCSALAERDAQIAALTQELERKMVVNDEPGGKGNAMADMNAQVPMSKVMSHVTMRVTVAGVKSMRIRLWVAGQLFKLGARLCGCGIEFVRPTPTEKP